MRKIKEQKIKTKSKSSTHLNLTISPTQNHYTKNTPTYYTNTMFATVQPNSTHWQSLSLPHHRFCCLKFTTTITSFLILINQAPYQTTSGAKAISSGLSSVAQLQTLNLYSMLVCILCSGCELGRVYFCEWWRCGLFCAGC